MGFKAFDESSIPAVTKGHLSQALKVIPNSRLLLIKSSQQHTKTALTFNIVVARERRPFYHSFSLDRYEDLLDVDIDAIVNGEDLQTAGAKAEPFYLVCTNGSRDPCCAQFGLRTFNALVERTVHPVWQCSHVGGHRFAANVLMFPQGIYYGRVDPADTGAILNGGEKGEIVLQHYRGRACYDPPVQAAEVLLRGQTGQRHLAAYRFVELDQLDEYSWSVRFLGVEDGLLHRISLTTSVSTEVDILSCRADKMAPVIQYELGSYQVGGETP